VDANDIKVGETYTNGSKRRRTVVGFSGWFVLYKTPSSGRSTSGVPLWDFAKWAKTKIDRDMAGD